MVEGGRRFCRMFRCVQDIFQCRMDRAKQHPLILKFDFGFLRMHIDVNLLRRDFDMQGNQWVTAVRQQRLIGGIDCPIEHATADNPSIDRKRLPLP